MGTATRVMTLAATALYSAVSMVLLAGCGGSVADADEQGATATKVAAMTPFCAAADAHTQALRPLNAMAAGGNRPANLQAAVDETRRTGSELVRLAPDDIRPDVERAVRVVNLQLDALLAHNGNAAELQRDPELTAQLASPDLAGAGERYRDYVRRTCRTQTGS